MAKSARWLVIAILLFFPSCSSTETATSPPQGPIVPTRIPVTQAPTSPANNGNQQIQYGETVTGEIRGSVVEVRYTFDGQADESITIRMQATSGDLDAYLILEGPDGTEIARNDDEDSARGFDAGLVNILLPESGTYTIIASRFNPVVGTTEGDFTLTLERGTVPETTPQPEITEQADVPSNTDIWEGEVISDRLDHDVYIQQYSLVGEPGQIITLEVQAPPGSELDPHLIVQSPGGRELARSDPGVDDASIAQIANLTLPEAGVYGVIVTRHDGRVGRSTGEYNLSMRDGDAAAEFRGLAARPIN